MNTDEQRCPKGFPSVTRGLGGFPPEAPQRLPPQSLLRRRWRIRAVQEQMIYWLERELN